MFVKKKKTIVTKIIKDCFQFYCSFSYFSLRIIVVGICVKKISIHRCHLAIILDQLNYKLEGLG